MIQAHAFYSGQVQGVGFRYTTVEIAREFAVTGWVRNLRDGRVELLAEGEAEAVQHFLTAVRQGSMRQYIAEAEVTWREATRQFRDFRASATAPAEA